MILSLDHHTGFVKLFIDYRIAPGHRIYDQMTQAARSIRANIAEGSPQCGKPLFRRTIKRGARQGQQFWGCSAYPSCNGTIDI